jgi:hypothetical protein
VSDLDLHEATHDIMLIKRDLYGNGQPGLFKRVEKMEEYMERLITKQDVSDLLDARNKRIPELLKVFAPYFTAIVGFLIAMIARGG